MERRRTKISRSWGATIGYLIGGLVALCLCILLFMSIVEGPVTIGVALIPGVAGFILLFMSFGGASRAACPACGATLSGLSTKSNDGVLCTACHCYSEGKDGLLWQTDENRIAEEAIFSSLLPEKFTFPNGCCVCGGTVANRERISLQVQNASSAVTATAVGVTTSTTVSVEVPHCTKHEAGARLTGTPGNPHIKFRSYAYLREFCQVNGTVPG